MRSEKQDTYVRARIDSATKQAATEALDDMGLSVSDAIRLLLVKVANERRLPFEISSAPQNESDYSPINVKAVKGFVKDLVKRRKKK